jgi:hypothetical protein
MRCLRRIFCDFWRFIMSTGNNSWEPKSLGAYERPYIHLIGFSIFSWIFNESVIPSKYVLIYFVWFESSLIYDQFIETTHQIFQIMIPSHNPKKYYNLNRIVKEIRNRLITILYNVSISIPIEISHKLINLFSSSAFPVFFFSIQKYICIFINIVQQSLRENPHKKYLCIIFHILISSSIQFNIIISIFYIPSARI